MPTSFQWPLALALHQLGTLIWIGGMIFAHFVLRPAANDSLVSLYRQPLMLAVFDRFFRLVWVAIAFIWLSGLWIFLVLMPGLAGWHVHAMMTVALVMTLVFFYLWSRPYRDFAKAVEHLDWPEATRHLALIRRLISLNLGLGLISALLGSAGATLVSALTSL